MQILHRASLRVPALVVILSLSHPGWAVAQDTSDTAAKLRAVANAVIKDATFTFLDEGTGQRQASPDPVSPEARLRPDSRFTDWRYWNGVLNIAMLALGTSLKDPAYAGFAARNISFTFDNAGGFQKRYKGEGKWNYPFGQFFIMEELDDYGAMGASVIEVYRRDPQDRYRAYIDRAATYALTKQNRLKDHTFVRAFPQKWTIWADDLYMSVSLLSRMGELSGDIRYFNDAARQVVNFHHYLFDEHKGLMSHCWYSDARRQGVAFWGRANGWAILAQTDLLDRLPRNHPARATLLALLQRHILGVARYQSGEGLWHQLLDKSDSYLETSCSAMFTYAVARAVNKGYLQLRYASIARRGWEGVLSRIRPDGQIEGVCTGTAVGDDLVFYYRRPAPLDDIHGTGAVLLAGAEVLQLPR